VRALGSGFQWHLAKPLEPSELLSVIVMLLAQKKGLVDPKLGDPKLGDLKIAELRN
jgi:DNA-binding response OmpR family regulator